MQYFCSIIIANIKKSRLTLHHFTPAFKTGKRGDKDFQPSSSENNTAQPKTPTLGSDIIRAHEQHSEKPGEETLDHILPDGLYW